MNVIDDLYGVVLLEIIVLLFLSLGCFMGDQPVIQGVSRLIDPIETALSDHQRPHRFREKTRGRRWPGPSSDPEVMQARTRAGADAATTAAGAICPGAYWRRVGAPN